MSEREDVEFAIRCVLEDVHIETGRKDEFERVVNSLTESVLAARQSSEAEPAIGDTVSIDVSTCDDDAQNRVFGTIVEPQVAQGERVWLCDLDHFNYDPPPARVPDISRIFQEAIAPAIWKTEKSGAAVTQEAVWDAIKALLKQEGGE